MSITTEKREQRFRKYYKEHATGKNRIYTPKVVRDKMIKYVKKDDKILVLYNIEFVVDFLLVGIKSSNILFVSDDEKRCQLVEDMNIKIIQIENYKQIKEKLENMQFDLIISNPPYSRRGTSMNADLFILDQIFEFGKKIVFIHPTNWIFSKTYMRTPSEIESDTKRRLTENLENLRKKTLPFLQDMEFFNAEEIFNVKLFVPVAIMYFDRTKKRNIDISFLDAHGTSELYLDMKEKILGFAKKSRIQFHEPNEKKWMFGWNSLRGNRFTNDWYTSVEKTNEKSHIGKKVKHSFRTNFETQEEAINFKNYLKLKSIRFCQSIFKFSGNYILESGSIPFMKDYSKTWTDEQVAKELNWSKKQLEFALNWIPNYYSEDEKKYGNITSINDSHSLVTDKELFEQVKKKIFTSDK